jgi:hypothetical protein
MRFELVSAAEEVPERRHFPTLFGLVGPSFHLAQDHKHLLAAGILLALSYGCYYLPQRYRRFFLTKAERCYRQCLSNTDSRLATTDCFALTFHSFPLVFLGVCNFFELDIVRQGGYPCWGKLVFWGSASG